MSKNKKLYILIAIIVLSFSSFLYFYLSPKTYEIIYEVDGFKIVERFNKEYRYYSFEISNDEFTYYFIFEFNYRSRRKLITNIEEIKEDNLHCIKPIIPNVDTYSLCYKDGELVSYFLINPTDFDRVLREFNGVRIYGFNNRTFLLWNYNSFYLLSENLEKEIPVLESDMYDIPLATLVNNNLFIPNYDQSNMFNEAFVINLRNGNKETWRLDNEIYYSSYIMGVYNQSIFLFDNRNRRQYELIPHRKRMREVTRRDMGKVYQRGWKDISVNRLATSNVLFEFFHTHNYLIRNNRLYLNFAGSNQYIRVSDKEDIKIISAINEVVFYLKDDRLYSFSPFTGEMLLLENFEWNFNYTNMIFIY